MTEIERIRAVKRGARAGLLAIAGVHAVGIGAKVVAGRATEEMAISVFLVKKRPPSEIRPDELIPTDIEGIKTDVIETEMPTTADVGAPAYPTTLTVTRSSATTIALAGSDVPGGGFIIMVLLTAGPSGATGTYNCSISTSAGDTLFQIASNLAQQIQTKAYVPATPDIDGTQIVLVPTAGNTASITSCKIWQADSTSYNPLVGGIQVQSVPVNMRGTGTLGCILVDSQSPPQVYGLTNYHVVALWGHTTPNSTLKLIISQVSPQQPQPGQATDIGFGTMGTGGSLPATLIAMTFYIDNQKPFEVVSLYTPANPPSSTAIDDAIGGIQGAINTVLGSSLTATVSGQTVTITPQQSTSTIVVSANCSNNDPENANQDLLSSLSADVTDTTITLSRSVNGDYYGIYTMFHVGGSVPSFGVFTPVKNGATTDSIASNIALSINQTTSDIQNQYNVAVGATATGSSVAVSGVKFVECNVNHDVRAKQPGGMFGLFSAVSGPGLRGPIGQIAAARYDVDAALIQLNPGIGYSAQVAKINGNLAGTVAASVNQLVQKRGRSSDVTQGTITTTDVDGTVGSFNSPPRVFFGAIRITSSSSAPFLLPGDSGSVLLDNSGGADNNKVVGLLFAGNSGGDSTIAMATPIDQVFQAFLPTVLQVATADGTAPAAAS